jgi:NAD(P)-dependent dehydrogenase (short-subunit alcohol dehydrogenase family)
MNTQPGVAVVTGAAGTIGAAICQALSDRFQVVGIDLTDSQTPYPVLLADVSDRAAVEAAAAEIEHRYGAVRLLVNNAGALTMNHFLDLTDNDWHTVFQVNAYGTFLASQVFARTMSTGHGGRIVNVASLAAKLPLPDQAHYCAAKAAVVMLTRVMALELADHGIRVFSICPGIVDTPLFRHCLDWTAQRHGRDPEKLFQEWLTPSLIGRPIEPEEVAELVLYLATGPTEALSGHCIPIDGGTSPW